MTDEHICPYCGSELIEEIPEYEEWHCEKCDKYFTFGW